MSIKPITPAEAKLKRKFPSHVIKAFNECIGKNMSGRSSTFTQDDVVDLICKSVSKNATTQREYRRTIYDNHWLDVEDLYRSVGWKVEFDKPAYNETYKAKFTFSA